MAITSRFVLAEAEDDAPEDRLVLARLRALGFELGAEVVVWRCTLCDEVEATFYSPAKPEGEGTR
jgi:hypothetical protein